MDRPRVAVAPPVLDALGAHGRPDVPGRPARARATRRRVARRTPSSRSTSATSPRSRRAPRLAPALAATGADVVLVLQTMAAPPAYALAVLDALPGVPVVDLGAARDGARRGRLRPRRDHDPGGDGRRADAHEHAGAVADGRSSWCSAGWATPRRVGRVREALRLATVASGIRRARLGRIGAADRGLPPRRRGRRRAARRHGHRGRRSDRARRGGGRYLAARSTPDGSRALDAEVGAGWDVRGGRRRRGEPGAQPAGGPRARGRRRRITTSTAGAFNCHVPQFRFGDEIGIAPCWALGRSTSAGVPFTCTGDILTAVAMLTTKRLGGAALYHEIEAIDYATGEVVIANSGEHDLAWLAPGERPRLRRNGWFCGKDPHCGVCAVLEPPAGPATLVGVHAAPRCARRVPVRGRPRRADRAPLPGDGHRQRRVPVPRGPGRGGLGTLGQRRRQPPQLGNARGSRG